MLEIGRLCCPGECHCQVPVMVIHTKRVQQFGTPLSNIYATDEWHNFMTDIPILEPRWNGSIMVTRDINKR